MAGHRLASDRAGDVSGRPRSDPDILQAHVPPVRSTRIETVCRPPDRTTGRTSSGHYPFCGTIYRVAENLFTLTVPFIFRCQTGCRIYKTGESESKRRPFTCPGICTSRIPLISIHADKDRALPRIGDAVPLPVRGHYPQRDYISVFLFFSFRCRHQRGSRDDYVFLGFPTGGAILSQSVPLTSGSVWVA